MRKINNNDLEINVDYDQNFYNKVEADRYFNLFENNLVYNTAAESKVTVFGKQYEIKRKQVAYGDEGTFYKFAGTTVNAINWHVKNAVSDAIKEIKQKVEQIINKTFNFVLINRYADGDDKIGAHRDDEKELGDKPVIVGVSFGAVRDIVFKPYDKLNNTKPIKLTLAHGSLFVMNYPTNTNWTHEIPSRANIKTPRISLTFRNMKK